MAVSVRARSRFSGNEGLTRSRFSGIEGLAQSRFSGIEGVDTTEIRELNTPRQERRSGFPLTTRVPTRICLRNVLASDLTAEPSPREWTGEGRVEEGGVN